MSIGIDKQWGTCISETISESFSSIGHSQSFSNLSIKYFLYLGVSCKLCSVFGLQYQKERLVSTLWVLFKSDMAIMSNLHVKNSNLSIVLLFDHSRVSPLGPAKPDTNIFPTNKVSDRLITEPLEDRSSEKSWNYRFYCGPESMFYSVLCSRILSVAPSIQIVIFCSWYSRLTNVGTGEAHQHD